MEVLQIDSNVKYLCDVVPSEIFEYMNRLYLKTTSVYRYDAADKKEMSCVDIETGIMVHIHEMLKVRTFKATLVLENEYEEHGKN